ncbi:ABC transporter substrate-binding protein [Fredinandcohnia sp. QZ13]|uniref:ABC transporter substrate-binding protein n=1 Tax=Fredinandcohnia sp. QZ13 TaxID=3073144 RepID=UPI0028533A52|nr:ABC transporter substrate-binding protein [Fredinandcohnia sp. QZ13]MDR4889914.1 ABC transporter substrate-binding protein [Fredinandcohnia sp. QZ13]
MEERYFLLRSHLEHYKKGRNYECKLEDVDAIWCCTRKNTKRIIRRLEDKKRLTYQPGKGRGNVSKVTYFTSFQEEIETFINGCLKKGELEKIAEILRLPIPKSWVVNFSNEIRGLLGIRHDQTELKDVLYAFKARDIKSLDPLRVSFALETHLLEYLGDTLIRYDNENDCFIPHIAHHFDVDTSGKVWTFYLRKGVFFHNHDYVTSTDVAYTINRFKNAPPSYSWLVRNIQKVECPHQYKVEIHLDEPNPFLLRYLSAPIFCILPSNVEFDELEWCGTGPFLVKERTNIKLVLQANDFYFKERPLIDEIQFYHVSNEAVKMLYLSSEEDMSQIKPTRHKIMNSGVQLLSFNLNRKNIIQQQTFREAIFHLFDVQKMAKDLKIDLVKASSLDIERSKSRSKSSNDIQTLIQLSGYGGETLNLYCFDHERARREGEWLKKEANKYGVYMNVYPTSYTEVLKEGIEEEIDMLIMGLSLSFDKHLAFSYAFMNKSLLFNRLFSKKVEEFVHRKIRLFELEGDIGKRTQIMDEVEHYLQSELAMFFLYHPIITRNLDSNIRDVESHSFGHIDYTKVWIPN